MWLGFSALGCPGLVTFVGLQYAAVPAHGPGGQGTQDCDSAAHLVMHEIGSGFKRGDGAAGLDM